MEDNTDKVTKSLFIITSVLVLSVIISNFYIFYKDKNYEFLVETECGVNESCFLRSCAEEECPPNGLEQYRLFSINASDFEQCSDDSCLVACTTGAISCVEIKCGESEEDSCSTAFTE